MTAETPPTRTYVIEDRDRCSRCRGTGLEPEPAPLTPGQREVLDQITELGYDLKLVSDARTQEGIAARRKNYNELRRLAARARNLGLTKPRIAGAAGLSRQGLHNILTHVTTV